MAKTILIADDEPDIVKILGLGLRANGYEVIAALHGDQAVEVAQREKPDLIILDIKMPGTDGLTVFEYLKASEDTMSIPIIFFSSLSPKHAQEKAMQLGADGFISKLADMNEILAKITEVLDKLES